jgi:hypothetical protein
MTNPGDSNLSEVAQAFQKDLAERGSFETDAHYGVSNTLAKAYPVGAKVPLPPAGITKVMFNAIVEASIVYITLSQESGNVYDLIPANLKGYLARPPKGPTVEVIGKVLESKEFAAVMVLRGMRPATQEHLSTEQMQALMVMSDVSGKRTSQQKLRRAGISWYKWKAWLNDPLFRATHDRMAANLFAKVQSDVDYQVASGALDGKLDYIKYFNELSGKHDPNRRAHQDVQTILNGIVEIITRNVTDEKVLKQISAELSAVVAQLG